MENTNSITTQDQLRSTTVPANNQAVPGNLDVIFVSYAEHSYINVVSPKPLSAVIDEIRSSHDLKAKIEKIRSEADPENRRLLKAKLLPYFMFMSYEDGIRDIAHFKSTRFILTDVDHVGDRMEELKRSFREDGRVFSFFVSPSGDGLKVVFALKNAITDPDDYRTAYVHFLNLLKKDYGIVSDASTTDCARCCFLSHDPELHVNVDAILLDLPEGKMEVTYNLTERKSGEPRILTLLKGLAAGGAGQPGRHSALVTLASFYKSRNIDFSATLATLQAWNQLNEPPLDEEDLAKCVEYVFGKKNYGNRLSVKPTTGGIPKVRKLWTGDEMKVEAQLSPIKELLEGVLADEGVYMLAGQDKSGKSLLGMNLALSIASDKDMFLNWKIKTHGPVVYCNNELSVKQMGRRLLQMDSTSSVNKVHNVHYMNDKDLRFDENIDEILEFCRTYQPVLVVVDCHYRTTSQDKDYGNAIQEVLENYTRIKEEMKCCVFVIHHTRKSAVGQRADSSQAMGSHTFAMMTDGNLQIKRSDTEPDKRILFETGSRDFSGFKPRLLQLNEMNLWFKDLGECNEEDHTQEINKMMKSRIDYPVKVLEGVDGGMLMKDTLLKEIMSQFKIGKSAAYNSFDRAIRDGKIAESSSHVVTLVKEPQELVSPAEGVKVEEPVLDVEETGSDLGHFHVSRVENE